MWSTTRPLDSRMHRGGRASFAPSPKSRHDLARAAIWESGSEFNVLARMYAGLASSRWQRWEEGGRLHSRRFYLGFRIIAHLIPRPIMDMRFSIGFLLFSLVAAVPALAKAIHSTIVYDDVATEINSAEEEAGHLWITTADLKRATRFEVKPQGVCRDELCFPLPRSRDKEFVRKSSGKTWFNLTAFAQLVSQPVAHDETLSTWYFGLRADQRQGLASLQAPDFTLPDMDGKPHSLSNFRGKKVFLVTWASW